MIERINILAHVPVNKAVKVERIIAGPRARKYLADLGIFEGETLKVLKNDFGPIVVEVKGTRVALGRGIANKVEVREL